MVNEVVNEVVNSVPICAARLEGAHQGSLPASPQIAIRDRWREPTRRPKADDSARPAAARPANDAMGGVTAFEGLESG